MATLFKKDAAKVFEGVNIYMSPEMENAIERWRRLEGDEGKTPRWVTDRIRTVRFSNTVARELARLVTMNIDIKVENEYGENQKANLIQDAVDQSFLARSQEIMEKVIRMGGVMAKWNGSGIDYLTPERFLVTDYDSNGNITGCIFFSYYTEGRSYYTRAEYHRFENDVDANGLTVKNYQISNRAFVSEHSDTVGNEISLAYTRWSDIEADTTIASLDHPLFSYLKSPFSNTIDQDSPLGISLFTDCETELEWLDTALSAMGTEQEDSMPVLFIDQSALQYAKNRGIELPKYVKTYGTSTNPDTTIQQWTPTLQVEQRKEAINFYLSIISYKCGFDAGYFVFNGQSIMATATQVEATERRTVNTVISYRNLLDRPATNGTGRLGFIHDLAYIIDSMTTLNGEAAATDFGNFDLYCDFADLTENGEENKAFDYQLAQSGFMSKVRFLVRNLGMTEEEARAMVEEAKADSVSGGLFAEGV